MTSESKKTIKPDVTVAIYKDWLKYWPELSKTFKITAWPRGFILPSHLGL